MKDRFLAATAALALCGLAAAAQTGEWRVNLLKGTRTQQTLVASTQEGAWAACQAAIPDSAPKATYTCQTPKYVAVVTPDPALPAPVDCVVTAWSEWSAGAWSACTGGLQTRTETRTRTVATAPANGGASCPALSETRTVSQACTEPQPDPEPDPGPPPTGQVITVNPGESISTAIARLEPGGTVIVKPGNYASFSLKACTSAAWCTVRAEIDGTVTVSGLSVGAGNWYTRLAGLKFAGSSVKVIGGSFVKLERVAIEGGPATGNNVTLQVGGNDRTPGASNILLEDVWVYGPGGRYKVLVYNAEKVVLRRVVVRHDGGWKYDSRNPQGGFALYDSRDVACQNCLFVDPASSLSGFEAAMYLVSNGTTSIKQSNVTVQGSVFLDSPNNGLAAEGNGSAATYSLADIAVVGSRQGGFNTNNSGHNLTVARALAKVSGYQYARWASGGSLKVNGCATGSGQLSSGASLTNCPGGPGPDLKRIGVDGTLFGEAGYDQVQGTLWPWPNEARIKADFDAVRPSLGGKSLTEYVQDALK